MSLPAMTSVSDLIPTSIVETSRASGWRSVEVMKAKIFADELEVKDLTTHTIAVNIGDAYHLRGIVDAAPVQAMMQPGMLKVVPSGPVSRWNWTSKAPLNILHVSVPRNRSGHYSSKRSFLRPRSSRASVSWMGESQHYRDC